MTAVIIIAVIAIVAAVLVQVTRHRATDERSSVRGYQDTLETLREMSRRNARQETDKSRPPAPQVEPSGDVRPLPKAPAGGSVTSGSGRRAPMTVAARGEAPAEVDQKPQEPGPPPSELTDGQVLVFDDVGNGSGKDARSASATSPMAGPSNLIGSSRAVQTRVQTPRRIPSLRRASKEPVHLAPTGGRRWFVAGAVVLLVVLAGGVAWAISAGSSKSASKTGVAARNTASTSHSSGSSGTAHGSSSRTPGHGQAASSPSSRKHATTTVPPGIQATSSSALQAAYNAPAGSYTIGLSASGPCWIMATETSTGTVLWTGTLQPGQTQQIPASGSLFLRLGAAFAVNVTLNGESVVLPSGHGSPFDLTFEVA